MSIARSSSALLVFGLWLSTVIPGSAVSFGAPKRYPAGSQPFGVAVGDFNRDGRRDLVVTNSGSNNVSVLLGNGNGTFRTAVNYAVGPHPQAVTVGDFNKDGKLDLAVANSGGSTISVLLGRGDGTFRRAVSYTVGKVPSAIVAADFNGDGRLDLAVANFGDFNLCLDSTVSILLGNGDGSFQPAVDHAAGECPRSLAVGDLNRDRKLDLVTQTAVLFGEGNGTFQRPETLNFGTGRAPGPVAIADLNHDGKKDLIGSMSANTIFPRTLRVLRGNGDGTFEAAASYRDGLWPVVLALADFNRDGNLDVAATSLIINAVSIVLGNGAGGLGSPSSFALGNLTRPAGIVAADFNGDGYPDLAITLAGTNSVAVLLNKH